MSADACGVTESEDNANEWRFSLFIYSVDFFGTHDGLNGCNKESIQSYLDCIGNNVRRPRTDSPLSTGYQPKAAPKLDAGQTRKEGWVVSIPYKTSDTEKSIMASAKELNLPTQRDEKTIDIGPCKDREDAIQLRTRLIEDYAIQGKLDWKAVVS